MSSPSSRDNTIRNPYKTTPGSKQEVGTVKNSGRHDSTTEDSTPLPHHPTPPLSPEQRRRISTNRERALQLLRVHQHTNTSQNAPTTPDRVEKTTGNDQSYLYSSPPHPQQQQLTPKQKQRIEANRKRALQLRQERSEPKKQRQGQQQHLVAPPPPSHLQQLQLCSRCHEPCDNQQLCIVWQHHGHPLDDHQQQQPQQAAHPSTTTAAGARNNIVRYSCCRRVDPQPCFVGTHHISSTAAQQQQQHGAQDSVVSPPTAPVHCHCGEPARLQRTHTTGRNLGRYYYRCGVPSNKAAACDFFQWADAAHGLPIQQPELGPDGVAEWLYPHVDPFHEDLGRENGPTATVVMMMHADTARQRLVAACLIRQMVLEVTRTTTTPSMGTTIMFTMSIETLVRKVNDVLRSGSDDITKHLFPLTQTQIHKRFGVLDDDLEAVARAATVPECNALLDRILERNPVLRGTVQRVGTGRTVNLKSLKDYYAI